MSAGCVHRYGLSRIKPIPKGRSSSCSWTDNSKGPCESSLRNRSIWLKRSLAAASFTGESQTTTQNLLSIITTEWPMPRPSPLWMWSHYNSSSDCLGGPKSIHRNNLVESGNGTNMNEVGRAALRCPKACALRLQEQPPLCLWRDIAKDLRRSLPTRSLKCTSSWISAWQELSNWG